jgi:ABC-type methionine transport system permease subunit
VYFDSTYNHAVFGLLLCVDTIPSRGTRLRQILVRRQIAFSAIMAEKRSLHFILLLFFLISCSKERIRCFIPTLQSEAKSKLNIMTLRRKEAIELQIF